MAVQLPDHLPQFAKLATSWVKELDSSIQATRIRIFQKINNDIPAFKQQLQSSMSIQTQLSELSTSVHAFTDSLNNPKTGILSTLLERLTAHGDLSAQTHISEVIHDASKHLLYIQKDLYELAKQIEQGQMTESAQTCVRLQRLINDAPEPLNKAEIMSAIQIRYRTLSDRLQKQLNDAHARSLWTLLSFLNSQFSPHLPLASALDPLTSHNPITSAALINLLETSIPSSVSELPSFLDIVDQAVHLEESLIPGSTRDRPIRDWANNIADHYEKKQRMNFLRRVKEVSSAPENAAQDETGHGSIPEEVPPRDEADTFDGWGWGDEEEEGDKVAEPSLQPSASRQAQETYSVSPRARKMLEILEDLIQEGQELMKSNVFTNHPSTKATVPGELLMAAVPILLDLHRALYPIVHSSLLLDDPNLSIRWSNDCKFLSAQATKLCDRHNPTSAERWLETAERLMALGELCYENAVLND